MFRSTVLLASTLLAFGVGTKPAAAQAMVEHSLGAASAAGGAGGAKAMGTSLAGALVNLEKVLSPGQPAATKTESLSTTRTGTVPRSRRKTAAAKAPPQAQVPEAPTLPAPKFEDPNQIAVGMGYDELLRRFGHPVLEFTNGPSSKTLSYLSAAGAVQVELVEGKVSSSQKPR